MRGRPRIRWDRKNKRVPEREKGTKNRGARRVRIKSGIFNGTVKACKSNSNSILCDVLNMDVLKTLHELNKL